LLALSERQAGVFDVVWKLPGPEAGLRTAGAAAPIPRFPTHCHRIDPVGSRSDGMEGLAYWRIDCGATGLRGEILAMSGLEGSRIDVIVRIAWNDGTATTGVLRSGADTLQMPAGPLRTGSGTPRAVVWSYFRLGVEHILLGWDHLLFVLGLLLLVRTWGMLLKTVSAFTVAHSLTLSLAVMGVVTVPAAPVEAAIALSIVLLAAELTRDARAKPGTLCRRYPWAVAFLFGLLHGLGFASALSQIGLPLDHIPLALLGFNLGVEAGQILFVAVMAGPVLALARLIPAGPRARLVPAYAIGALAVAWTIERVVRFWMPMT
jgi:hydrogenase/urease accessory protein HupE